jgi:DNA-directed RNA polymerase omega subunit
MTTKTLSRGPQVNLQQCVEAMDNSRYNLVLVAAARARELVHTQKQNDWATHINAPVSALLDVQQGLVGLDYLRKIR